jgi:glycine oxidase
MPFAVEPVRGQIVCLRTEPGRIKHVIHSRRGYVVPRADGRVLVGSTSEHAGFENVVTETAVAGLKKVAVEISPFLDLETHDAWSGLRPFAGDGYPIFGALTGIEGAFIATAHYRNGILLAPLTAEIVAENIVNGGESKYFTTFAVDRFSEHSVGTGGKK